jgi:hypothetical protein
MVIALATKGVRARSGLTMAWRSLLLTALAYGISYLVSACISSDSLQVTEEPRSTAFDHGSGFNLHAELVCGSAAPRLRERTECNLPK